MWRSPLEELEKKRQQSFAVKEEYRQEIEKLTTEQRDKTRELETISKRYNIALGTELDEWAKDPKRYKLIFSTGPSGHAQ